MPVIVKKKLDREEQAHQQRLLDAKKAEKPASKPKKVKK